MSQERTEKLTEYLKIRIGYIEAQQIDEACEQHEITKSEFARQAIRNFLSAKGYRTTESKRNNQQ